MSKPTHNSFERSKKPHPAETPLPYYGSKAATTSLALPFRLTTAGLRGTRNCAGCGCSFVNDFRDARGARSTPSILGRTSRLIKLLSSSITFLSAATIAMLALIDCERAHQLAIDIVLIVRVPRMARPRPRTFTLHDRARCFAKLRVIDFPLESTIELCGTTPRATAAW
jgi:hypothetical protein